VRGNPTYLLEEEIPFKVVKTQAGRVSSQKWAADPSGNHTNHLPLSTRIGLFSLEKEISNLITSLPLLCISPPPHEMPTKLFLLALEGKSGSHWTNKLSGLSMVFRKNLLSPFL
jgi:hypothetical protein